MLPNQFNRLINTVRGLFEREIQQASEKQEGAIRDAAKATEEECGKIPGVIARVATAIEAANADVETYEKPQRKKEHGLQKWFLVPAWITAISTTIAFVAAFVYACIANRQLTQMQKQTKDTEWAEYYGCLSSVASQKSAEASRVQANAAIVSEEAVIVETFAMEPLSRIDPATQFYATYHFRNIGKSVARNLNIVGTAIVLPKDGKLTFEPNRKTSQALSSGGSLPAGETIPNDAKWEDYSQMMFPLFVSDKDQKYVYGLAAMTNILDSHKWQVFTYGKLTYTDFSGPHWKNFCHFLLYLRPGESSTNEFQKINTACNSYNQEDSHDRQLLEASQTPAPKCVIPKE